ncbi:uncharacterized protein LOC127259241 [Andrographis paniculata]|uniref:uncharacterized protein LOC127259241 n=1 Tax=Andrographis paniculata TaxID=175694 RepID=UPI0021E8EBD7|nr:uncharacterized protein LOC127259241 [Andrographis paniculata]
MASSTSPKPEKNAAPVLQPEFGPDGIIRESPVIAYTEKIIEEERLQLRKYIEENYSKIRDVERELANLTMEMKLTSGPKKHALELMRKKIEMSTERIHVAKQKEELAKKAWEEAAKAVKDEEAVKQKLCEDLNNLVLESSNAQLTRLEELKRRMESLNPSRASVSTPTDGNQRPAQISTSAIPSASSKPENVEKSTDKGQQPSVDGAGGRKKAVIHGKVRGIGAVPKGRNPASPGWTGSGFDVDSRV